jgi:ankyrin repeat protein
LQTLFTFRLLDDLFDKRRVVISTEMLLSYLAYRAAHEPADGNALLLCIKRVAIELHGGESTVDRDPIAIEGYVRNILPPMGKRAQHVLQWKGEVSEAYYATYVLAAGIRMDNLSIVRRCLEKNQQLFSELNCLRKDNLIYGLYDKLVATYAGVDSMAYLMTYGVSTVDRQLRLRFFEGAAQAGRADIVRWIYDFKKEEVPWNLTANSWESSEHTALYRAENTASLEVLRFVAELRAIYHNPTVADDRAEYSLDRCVDMGRLDTVAYAVQLGAHPRGLSSMGHPRNDLPVRKACRRGHIAIVEYLLAHGAGPERTVATAAEWGHAELVQRLLELGISPVGALSRAAAGGYLDVVRLLLDAGVDANETPETPSMGVKSPLANAIWKEHTAMFDLLLDRGADLHAEGVAEECVQRAKEDGLESMLLLLKEHGVDIGDGEQDNDQE